MNVVELKDGQEKERKSFYTARVFEILMIATP
jgi:hypothetical protein